MLHVFTIVFASTLSNLVAQSAHAGCVAPVLLQMQASQLSCKPCDDAASTVEISSCQVLNLCIQTCSSGMCCKSLVAMSAGQCTNQVDQRFITCLREVNAPCIQERPCVPVFSSEGLFAWLSVLH